jgi:hypothetical protein
VDHRNRSRILLTSLVRAKGPRLSRRTYGTTQAAIFLEADGPKSDRADLAHLLRQYLPSGSQEDISVDHQEEVSAG